MLERRVKEIPKINEMRFLSKIVIIGDCWYWVGVVEKTGYGTYWHGRHLRFRAHRVSYDIFRGPISTEMVIDHICKNRRCVNPDHLRQVSHVQNVLENSNSITAANVIKTHCPSNHLYDMVVMDKRGPYRSCSTCRKNQKKRKKNDHINR